jgi:hypothetical protein
MMRKLLLVLMMIPVMQQIQAQEEIVKWTFPTGQMGDTIQNGTNTLNLTQVIRIQGAGPITMTNGQATGDFAATATGWDNGMNIKNWYVDFKTTGYGNVKISFKQRAGGNNGGPINFTLQYKIGLSGTWADVPGGSVTLGNNWTAASVSNLDLPAECQNQSDAVYVRWIMNSNTDILGGSVAATGISKIDEIIVTGSVNTGIKNDLQVQNLCSFPNPSTSAFSIEFTGETSAVEIYNNLGQLMYKAIPTEKIVRVDLALQPGLYFIKTMNKGKASIIKHIVK